MGHSTILMTMRYAHLAPGGGREYLAAVDAGPIRGNSLATGEGLAMNPTKTSRLAASPAGVETEKRGTEPLTILPHPLFFRALRLPEVAQGRPKRRRPCEHACERSVPQRAPSAMPPRCLTI